MTKKDWAMEAALGYFRTNEHDPFAIELAKHIRLHSAPREEAVESVIARLTGASAALHNRESASSDAVHEFCCAVGDNMDQYIAELRQHFPKK